MPIRKLRPDQIVQIREAWTRRHKGCPLTPLRSPWCYGLCEPVNQRGVCGRIAGHAFKSLRQRGMAEHKRRKLEALAARRREQEQAG